MIVLFAWLIDPPVPPSRPLCAIDKVTRSVYVYYVAKICTHGIVRVNSDRLQQAHVHTIRPTERVRCTITDKTRNFPWDKNKQHQRRKEGRKGVWAWVQVKKWSVLRSLSPTWSRSAVLPTMFFRLLPSSCLALADLFSTHWLTFCVWHWMLPRRLMMLWPEARLLRTYV